MAYVKLGMSRHVIWAMSLLSQRNSTSQQHLNTFHPQVTFWRRDLSLSFQSSTPKCILRSNPPLLTILPSNHKYYHVHVFERTYSLDEELVDFHRPTRFCMPVLHMIISICKKIPSLIKYNKYLSSFASLMELSYNHRNHIRSSTMFVTTLILCRIVLKCII